MFFSYFDVGFARKYIEIPAMIIKIDIDWVIPASNNITML